MKRTATAITLALAEAPKREVGAVAALRERLSGSTAREHVVLDFLEDDLRESRAAVAAVAAFLQNVEAALSAEEPSPEQLFSLARAVDPAVQVDYLQTVLASVRRRLSQVATRM